jgi:hypothetical protein
MAKMKKPPSQREQPKDIRVTAFHEAGHAVALVILGLPLKNVDVLTRRYPDGASHGASHSEVDFSDYVGKGIDAVKPWMIQSLAGPIAELRVHRDSRLATKSGKKDWEMASQFAALANYEGPIPEDGNLNLKIDPSRFRPQLEAASDEAAKIVGAHWPVIVRVAEMLISRKSLTGDEVAAIVSLKGASDGS